MKKHLSKLAFLLAIVMMVSMLAACGGGGSSSAAQPAGSTAGSSTATADDKPFAGTTIEYAGCFTEGEAQAKWIAEMAKEWEAETGATVKLNFIGRDILTQIKTRVLTGDAPDIIDQDASEAQAAFLTNEVMLEPLDDIYTSSAYGETAPIKDTINGAYSLYTQPDGHDYFVPFIFITAGFFYDKTMFAQYDLSAPSTWTEFEQVCDTLLENGVPPIALDGNISFYNAYYYKWAVQQVMGSGNFLKAAQDETGAAWDDPGYLKAAELVHELSKSGKNYFQPGYEGSVYPAGQADWALGKSGMVFCGTWIPLETGSQAGPDFQYGFFPFPTVEGGKGVATDMEAQLMSWCIPSAAKNKEAAKDFIRFCSSKKAADRLVEMSDNMSARTDAIYPDALADVKPYVDKATNFHKNYDGVMSDAPEWWANVFYPADNDLIFGTTTPEQFIEQIKAESIKFYKNKQ